MRVRVTRPLVARVRACGRDGARLARAAGACVLVVALGTALAQPAAAQVDPSHPISAQQNEQIFATMCALYAAGFDNGEPTPGGDPVIVELRARLLEMKGPATEDLRRFYRAHVLADPTATMSRYITFALVAGPAPKFAFTMERPDLPPDVLTLDGFNDVLANFYREAKLADLWQLIQPTYAQEVDAMRAPLGQMVLTEAGYLREIVKPGRRTFTVYVEPLVLERTNMRNIGDRYAIVVNPAAPPMDEIRHAFLHFLLDPLPLRYAQQIQPLKPLLHTAAAAPQLEDDLREDLSGYVAECLVHAVELRLTRPPAAQLAAGLDVADADGYVLERPFVAALAKFEASEPAMSLYFPDLLQSMDVAAESKRVSMIAFAPASRQESAAAAKANPEEDVDRALADGERMIATHDAPGAQAAFESVLKREPDQPRALYGLAVATVLEGDGARARELFEKAVSAAGGGETPGHVDPVALAWSHGYLGRMNDLDGNRDAAMADYQAALAVEGAPEAARAAAQRGVEQSYQPAEAPAQPK